MEQKHFEVEITFQQSLRYAVDAADRKAAERMALERWQDGEKEGIVESECCKLVSVHTQAAPRDEGVTRDCEKVLRYLRDRELVIEQLDPDAFNPTIHDAVSAEAIALHFGWRRRDNGAVGEPDVPRAARVLDRLCRERRVVCFDRPRVRAGERGDIRLYCTPEHLERLSALLEPEAAGAGV
ncbi:MAG TPA: hypothetical protein VFX98_16120 [Longimicrobiaceae bacterium]|nr:hypothetical protein [Longimicrobiaceae bacterium]